jgi:choline kinase
VKAIIIGAGRGKRLEHLTDDRPKTLVPILGRPMLDMILGALRRGGIEAADTVFIRGYRGELIERAHPELSYVENREWEHNNILLSLFCAREQLRDGFVSSYADIVYEPVAVERLMQSPHDITLVCDRAWRARYLDRSKHPEGDAEKLRAEGDRIVELSRHVRADQATGEFIGVMRCTQAGAEMLLDAFDRALARHGLDGTFREGRSLRKAYLIDLLAEMIAEGIAIHGVFVDGGYMEIDTTEDAAMAEHWWRDRPRETSG